MLYINRCFQRPVLTATTLSAGNLTCCLTCFPCWSLFVHKHVCYSSHLPTVKQSGHPVTNTDQNVMQTHVYTNLRDIPDTSLYQASEAEVKPEWIRTSLQVVVS